jgi:multidrug efflux pump subunit AcrB
MHSVFCFMRIQDSSSSDAVLNAIIVFFATSVVVVVIVVVVNDSSLLIESANRRQRDGGASPEIAIQQAGIARLRAILLTSLTTFGGLAPMILETLRPACCMIPMAISLGFGRLSATIIVLVPCTYLILVDLATVFRRKRAAVAAARLRL